MKSPFIELQLPPMPSPMSVLQLVRKPRGWYQSNSVGDAKLWPGTGPTSDIPMHRRAAGCSRDRGFRPAGSTDDGLIATWRTKIACCVGLVAPFGFHGERIRRQSPSLLGIRQTASPSAVGFRYIHIRMPNSLASRLSLMHSPVPIKKKKKTKKKHKKKKTKNQKKPTQKTNKKRRNKKKEKTKKKKPIKNKPTPTWNVLRHYSWVPLARSNASKRRALALSIAHPSKAFGCGCCHPSTLRYIEFSGASIRGIAVRSEVLFRILQPAVLIAFVV